MLDPSASLELAHCLLLELREADADGPRDLIHACLGQIYYALDGRFDSLACVRQAQGFIGEALSGSLPPLSLWPSVAQLLGDAERGFALQSVNRPAEIPPFLAATGELPARSLHRSVLLPYTGTPSAEAWLGELQPPADQTSFVSDPFPPFSQAGWARMRLQIYFQDLAALTLSRMPQMGESWRSVQVIELRMLQLIDAIHTLGADLAVLEELALQSPAPDPGMVAGLALALGTLLGRDALAASERYFCKWESEPGFSEALWDAWGILPNPAVNAAVWAWLRHPRAARRALAVRLLARRGAMQSELLEAALRDEADVAAAALLPYVLLGSERTRYVLDEVYARLLNTPAADPAIVQLQEQFQVAGLLAGYPGVYAHLISACREGRPGTGALAGIGAERTDARHLLECMIAAPNRELVEAVGWAGDPESIPYLIDALRRDDQEVVFSAAAALERITGAKLLDWFEIPVESAMEDDLGAAPPGGAPLDPKDPRDPPPEGSPDRIELPSIDPIKWTAYVEAHAEQLKNGVRTRRGYPYTHMVSLYELDQVVGARRERRTLCYEMVLRTGAYFSFDEQAFVGQQELLLQQLSTRCATLGTTPGSFALPLKRTVLSA